jgi:hypothetical protein
MRRPNGRRFFSALTSLRRGQEQFATDCTNRAVDFAPLLLMTLASWRDYVEVS